MADEEPEQSKPRPNLSHDVNDPTHIPYDGTGDCPDCGYSHPGDGATQADFFTFMRKSIVIGLEQIEMALAKVRELIEEGKHWEAFELTEEVINALYHVGTNQGEILKREDTNRYVLRATKRLVAGMGLNPEAVFTVDQGELLDTMADGLGEFQDDKKLEEFMRGLTGEREKLRPGDDGKY